MMTVKKEFQEEINVVTLEELVPEDHLVRKIDKAIDFSFIRDLVKPLYCLDNGRPSIDPVILFKIIVLKHVFGIKSIRQTIKDIQVNVAYKWFLKLGLLEKVPHFTTISTNYSRRNFKDVENKIFEKILEEAIKHNFIDASQVFIDSTHIKAHANKRKYVRAYIKKAKKEFEDELKEEINRDRESHNKKPLKEADDSEVEMIEIKQSTTDPESGYFHKGEKEKVFAYTATTACDKKGFILGTYVCAGNTHDSVSFFPLYNQLMNGPHKKSIDFIVVDSAYKTPAICKKVLDNEITLVSPYKRPMTKKGFLKKYEYVYDEYYDCYICPNNKILNYKITDKNGYKKYESNPKDCINCPLRSKCTENKDYIKTVTRHVWQDYVELADEERYKPYFKEMYAKRKETIERAFGDGKENHGLRYTRKRGREKVQKEVTLIYACMNLKKLALWLSKPPKKVGLAN